MEEHVLAQREGVDQTIVADRKAFGKCGPQSALGCVAEEPVHHSFQDVEGSDGASQPRVKRVKLTWRPHHQATSGIRCANRGGRPPPGAPARRSGTRPFENGCQAMPRSVPRPPRPGPPHGGSAPGCGWSVSIGPARGSVAPAISRKRVRTSQGAVYPPREARGVREVARVRSQRRPSMRHSRQRESFGIGISRPRGRTTKGGETWLTTEPASRRRGRSHRCGSSTARHEAIFPEPPVWRRICCMTTRNNSGR